MNRNVKNKNAISFVAIVSLLIIGLTTNAQRIIVDNWENGNEKVVFDISKGTATEPIDYYFIKFYPNGEVYKKGNFVDSEASGEWKFFYQNGNLKSVGNYRRGNLVGEFVSYYITGEVEQQGLYQVGQLAIVNLFNVDGTEKEKDEDLHYLITDNKIAWTLNQKKALITDCVMPMDGTYKDANQFCTCLIDSAEKYIEHHKYYKLSEYQRTLIFKYLMEEKDCCLDIIKN